MTILDEITAQTNGASFLRADLHIHSYGEEASYDVDDPGMTVEGIVDTALAESLQVISITDHNRIGNVKAAVEYGNGKGLLVIPGVELSTPQGHLLIYCSSVDQLTRLMGKLDGFVTDREEVRV